MFHYCSRHTEFQMQQDERENIARKEEEKKQT
jgi:hypothetical protein